MQALCPDCGFHHTILRALEEGVGEARRDIYQVEPLGECERTYLSDADVLLAIGRFGREGIVEDEVDEDEVDGAPG